MRLIENQKWERDMDSRRNSFRALRYHSLEEVKKQIGNLERKHCEKPLRDANGGTSDR